MICYSTVYFCTLQPVYQRTFFLSSPFLPRVTHVRQSPAQAELITNVSPPPVD